MLAWLLPRVLPWVFKPWTMAVVGLAVLFGLWQVDRYRQFNAGIETGEKQVIEKSVKEGKANAVKSKQAHTAARKPGAAERLREDSCRDC